MGLINRETLASRDIALPDSPIKIDAIDLHGSKGRENYRAGTSHMIFTVGILGGIAPIFFNGFNQSLWPFQIAVTSSAMLNSAYHYARNGSLNSQIKRLEREHSVKDSNLGYRADRVVYRGDKVLNGTNFYHIQLPELKLPNPGQLITASDLSAMRDYYAFALNDIRNKIRGKQYDIVFIDLAPLLTENPALQGAYQASLEITRRHVYYGKEVKIKDEDRQCIALPKETFESIPLQPQEAFRAAINSLREDRKGAVIASKVETALNNGGDGREAEMQRLRQYLNRTFDTQIEAIFGGASLMFDRQGGHYRKRKITYSIQERKTASGRDLLQVSYNDGTVRRLPINFKQPLEEIITSQSPYKVILLTNALIQMLQQHSIDELTQESIRDKNQILQQLQAQGITIKAVPQEKNPIVENDTLPHGLFRKIRPALSALLLIGALKAGSNALESPKAITNNISSSYLQTSERPRFPEVLPQSKLDWKIESHGLDSQGYYILSTSHEYANGQWQYENGNKTPINIASSVAVNTPYLLLTGNMSLDAFGNASFKLPIKDYSQVNALLITDINGNTLHYNAYRLDDGTIEIDVQGGFLNGFGSIQVQEALISSPHSVHATQRIRQIDVNKLSPQARRLLANINFPSFRILYELANEISAGQEYSIDPKNKNVLQQTNGTAESFINAAASLLGSDCEIANSEFALLSSATEELAGSMFVNIANGFIVENTPGGTTNLSLNELAAHEFTVTDSGNIVDATPYNIAKDKLTQQYIQELHGSNNDVSAEAAWEQAQQAQQDESVTRQGFYRTLEILGGVVALAAGAVLTEQGVKRIRRVANSENIASLIKKIQLLRFSNEDLVNAYNFFNWISWGYPANAPLSTQAELVVSNKLEGAAAINSNLHGERILDYLTSPQQYEDAARVSKADAEKFRKLARLLYNSS